MRRFRVTVQYPNATGGKHTTVKSVSYLGAKQIATRRFGDRIHPSATWRDSKVYGAIKRGKITESTGWIQVIDLASE